MIKHILRTTLGLAIVVFLLVIASTNTANAGECKTQIQFDIKPNPAPYNQPVTLSGTVSFTGSVLEPPGTTNAGYCLIPNVGDPVKSVYILFDTKRLGTGIQGVSININQGTTGSYNFSKTITPSESGSVAGDDFSVAADVRANGSGGWRLTKSSDVAVNLEQGVFGTRGCLADDGKYACSPGNLSDCSDASACSGKTCLVLDDSSLCGKTPPKDETHAACRDTFCEQVAGPGQNECSSNADCKGGGGLPTENGGTPSGPSNQTFKLENPIGVTNFQDLINIIARWIFNLAIPIAIIVIIYAGILMLTAGDTPSRFQKGTQALKYAVIGLAVVLIGRGFVTLIKSILDLRN
ncbi:MAG: hypothetical protein WD898_03300 [Candidatus Paceibacterota bacterium]